MMGIVLVGRVDLVKGFWFREVGRLIEEEVMGGRCDIFRVWIKVLVCS